jgi:arginyl-tRNA synthetase
MKEHIEKLVASAVAALPEIDAHPEILEMRPVIERTRDLQHGDFACNIAMQLARSLHQKPRDLAQSIVANMPASERVEAIEIAGPGFINFRLTPHAFHEELTNIVRRGERYGTSELASGKKVLVEYVSANPTGPLHVGHGRHAAYGSSVANLLAATGHDVHREYYVNDAGRQMDILTVSVWLRMFESVGIEIAFPDNGYRGDYIVDIANEAAQKFPGSITPDQVPALDDLPADAADGTADVQIDQLIAGARESLGTDTFSAILRFALDAILGDIKNDMTEFGTAPDQWFSEQSLMSSGAVDRALQRVSEHGKSYEKDGATWFRATEYGDEKDRVVVRDNGRTTYFASDIAYHLEKRERGFDLMLDILGADHHGYVARVRGGLEAMGEPPDSLEVELVQFVALFRGEEKVQMSTRSGQFVTLRELREEVGNDAARFFFVSRSNEQHLDFDLDLAKSQTNDNPVYYVQYAHARVWSVMRELESRSFSWTVDAAIPCLDRLAESHEHALMRAVARYPEVIELAARQRAPQHVVHYLRELAQDFHTYYNAHRFLVEDDDLRNARLLLINAARQVFLNGLAIIGVSAPKTM